MSKDKSRVVDSPILPRLPAAVPRAGVSEEALLALRQLLGDGDRLLAEAFRAGTPIDKLIRARCEAVQNLVVHVWTACIGDATQVALYAVGGFGRGELFPFSDVDLLVLTGGDFPSTKLRALETFFARLWDIGLKPGHALRTVGECREVAAADETIYTSLLDARRIAGDAQVDTGLDALLNSPEIWPPDAYLQAKTEDREQRYARFNDTAYNLEPNIKDGPGGLRSLHLVHWLGRRLFAAPTLPRLVECGLITQVEADDAEQARQRLSHIRYGLHLAAGRAEERLLFDYQRTLAVQFGFTDEHGRNLAVEQFMQGYYRSVIGNDRLVDRFLQRAEEALHPDPNPPVERLSLDFVAVNARLDCDPPDLFLQRPAALIDMFRCWIEHPHLKGLRADVPMRIEQALQRHGKRLAEDADVNTAFARLLHKGAPAVDAIARMNYYGVLAHYLPAFGRIVGRMQYDLFHMYTVDEHTMRVLRNVARFDNPETCTEFAHANEVWQRIQKPELLLLAALFHDIAKGRGGNHSELGETDARAFCTQLGLPGTQVEIVAWLVRWHLLMSETAQRKDVNDPQIVHEFAARVGDWERLDLLYLLTVSDIAGTSTKLWNSWKDKLLSDLYVNTRFMLRGGLESPPQIAALVSECREQARELLLEQGMDADTLERVWADFPDEGFLRFAPEEIAWHTQAIEKANGSTAPLVLVEPEGLHGTSEVFVHALDRAGLFAVVTAVLDRMRFSVHDARIVTLRSGMSQDSFLVLETDGSPISDPSRIQRLQRALTEVLSRVPYRAELRLRPSPRPLRHFQVATRISFGAAPVGRTQLALVCSDRPGLLAKLAKVLHDCGIRVHDARIATFGERVEDFFQISDAHDQPLSESACETLREALLEQLDNVSNTRPEHAIA